MIKHILFFLFYLISVIIIPILFIPLAIAFKLLNINIDLWQLNCKIFIFTLLRLKHHIIFDSPLIKQGYILANHRCFFDFPFDAYITRSSSVGRIAAFLVVFPSAILGFIQDRLIYFQRGKTGRQEIFLKMKAHMLKNSNCTKRILFYPEGNRKTYTSLNSLQEVKDNLKYGILKEIYLDKKYPVQIVLTSRKDEIYNERKLSAKCGLYCKTIVNAPIYPENYEKFEDFIEEIAANWLLIYHNL